MSQSRARRMQEQSWMYDRLIRFGGPDFYWPMTQEVLAGVRVVRAYRQEPFEIGRFRASNAEYVARNRTLIRLQGVFYPSIELLMGVGVLLVLWLMLYWMNRRRIFLRI